MLKNIIDTHYSKHKALIKYLDNENIMREDLTLKAPEHNISQDVEKLE
jgi:hypothetical protein